MRRLSLLAPNLYGLQDLRGRFTILVSIRCLVQYALEQFMTVSHTGAIILTTGPPRDSVVLRHEQAGS
jgi:hypothetical protein